MAVPARPRVLLAEDEAVIREGLAALLSRAGLDVRTVADGDAALAAVLADEPAVVVLDVLMPALDGREVLRRLRSAGRRVPVLLLTQVGGSGERALALEEGADDYLNKPFDPAELVARVRALLRRTAAGASPPSGAKVLESTGPGGAVLALDRPGRRARLDGAELALTPKALALLEHLLVHPDELVTRERLLEAVWGFSVVVATRAVDNRVAELRRALGDDAERPGWVQTVSGAGYRWVAPVRAAHSR